MLQKLQKLLLYNVFQRITKITTNYYYTMCCEKLPKLLYYYSVCAKQINK